MAIDVGDRRLRQGIALYTPQRGGQRDAAQSRLIETAFSQRGDSFRYLYIPETLACLETVFGNSAEVPRMKCKASERLATVESVRPYFDHILGYDDFLEFQALPKCIVADSFHAGGKIDAAQFDASVEGRIVDEMNVRRFQPDSLQLVAEVETVLRYGVHPGLYHYRRHFSLLECRRG